MTFSRMYMRDLIPAERQQCEFHWTVEEEFDFQELILSWNGFRPQGIWTFFVSLKNQNDWSDWLKYAEWSFDGQRTFKSAGSFTESHQDTVTSQVPCQGFRIKIISETTLSELHSLSVCVSLPSQHRIEFPKNLNSVFLKDVPYQSQMTLNHPRHRDFCSPTSTSIAINYLLQQRDVDPVHFARSIRDDEFDIYGNWILNTAEAYQKLRGAYRVSVQRLPNFEALHLRLRKGMPVVVSVKGTLPGAPLPYSRGHLICVTGFDARNYQVRCADPAFPTIEGVSAHYALSDFLAAWGERRNLAYVFEKVPRGSDSYSSSNWFTTRAGTANA